MKDGSLNDGPDCISPVPAEVLEDCTRRLSSCRLGRNLPRIQVPANNDQKITFDGG